MKPEAYIYENRLSEVFPDKVVFSKITGNVRQSKSPIWWLLCDDIKRSRRLAKRWAFKRKLGEPVLS